MPKTVLGIRISVDDLTELKKRATKENMTPSAYASKLLKEALSEQQRIDLAINKINDECMQIEGMLSIMQTFNKEVFATMLGRSEVSFSSQAEKDKAIEKRKRAIDGLENFINKASQMVTNGENIWGSINNI